MSIFKRIFSNTVAQVVGKVFTSIISVVLVKILANYLGVNGLGYYMTVYEYLAIFGIVADFGMYTIAVREMAGKSDHEANFIFANVLSMRVIITAVACLLAYIIINFVPAYAGTVIPAGVQLMVVATFVALMAGTMTSILQVHYQMSWASLAQVVGKLASLAWIVAVVLWFNVSDHNLAILWTLAAGIVGNVLQLVLTFIYVNKIQRVYLAWDFAFWQRFLIKTIPYGVSIVLATVYFKVDTLLLSVLKGADFVGVYVVAMRLIEVASFLALFFLNSLLPELARVVQTGQTVEILVLLRKSWLLLFLVAVPLSLFGFVFAEPLTVLLASRDFLSGGVLVVGSEVAIKISIFALLFTFLNYLLVYTVIAYERQLRLLLVNGLGLLFNIVVNWWLIPIYGIVAAAGSTVVVEILILGLNFYLLRQQIKFTPPLYLMVVILGWGLLVAALAKYLFLMLFAPLAVGGMLAVGVLAVLLYIFLVLWSARELRAIVGEFIGYRT